MAGSNRRSSVTRCSWATHVLLLQLCVFSAFLQNVRAQPDPDQVDSIWLTTKSAEISDQTAMTSSEQQSTETVPASSQEMHNSVLAQSRSTHLHDVAEDQVVQTCSYPSCVGRCFQRCMTYACSCLPQCFVYNNCCPDAEEECPDLNDQASTFGPELLEAPVTCATDIGKYVISECPSRIELTTQQISARSSGLGAYQPYVFDTSTGLLYKNTDIYNCYATNVSDPKVWQIVVGIREFTTDFDTIEDLLQFVENAPLFYRPTSSSHSGDLCQRDDGSRTFRFSLTVNFNNQENQISIVPNGDKPQGWTLLTCGLDSSGQCVHARCTGSERPWYSGKCVRRSELLVRGIHPPGLLSFATVWQMAEILMCALEDQSEIYDVNPLVVSATDPRQGVPEFREEHNGESERYHIGFEVVHSETLDFENAESHVKQIAAYFLIELGIAYGSNALYYGLVLDEHGNFSVGSSEKSTKAVAVLTAERALRDEVLSSLPLIDTNGNEVTRKGTTALHNKTYPVLLNAILTRHALASKLREDILQRPEEVFPQCLPWAKPKIASGQSQMQNGVSTLPALIIYSLISVE